MGASSSPVAFINMPYAPRYERVYLAFIAGLAGFGMVPTAAVKDPSSQFQLDRIFNLVADSDYSFHDLSHMTVDRSRPRTPRFNMPFELGLAVATSAEESESPMVCFRHGEVSSSEGIERSGRRHGSSARPVAGEHSALSGECSRSRRPQAIPGRSASDLQVGRDGRTSTQERTWA